MGPRTQLEFLASGAAKFSRSGVAASLAASLLLFLSLPLAAGGQESATSVWRGRSHPIAVSGRSGFSVADSARALGFTVSREESTGVLTLSGHGREAVVRAGTREIPVAEPTPAPLSLEVAVVHVSPTTQVVLKQSSSARFVPSLTETGFRVRWPGQRLASPFPARRYEDPLVSAIRFSEDAATIEFREPGLTARAYPLTEPDRVVIEVGVPAPTPPAELVTPPPPAPSPILIVLDPGHGGPETGAIGPGGLMEKEVTLELARRIAAAIPRVLSSRVVLTRDSDSAISLDDRTAVANHERADLFLSLHANSSRSPGAHGSETYYLSLEASDRLAQEVARRENQGNGAPASPAADSRDADLGFILWDLAQSAHLKESSELAEAIQEELNIVSRTENRGIKQAPFRVLVGAAMPAVLVEAAFISNAEEEKKLNSPVFQQSVADAVARALGRFFARRRPAALRVPTPAPTPTASPAP